MDSKMSVTVESRVICTDPGCSRDWRLTHSTLAYIVFMKMMQWSQPRNEPTSCFCCCWWCYFLTFCGYYSIWYFYNKSMQMFLTGSKCYQAKYHRDLLTAVNLCGSFSLPPTAITVTKIDLSPYLIISWCWRLLVYIQLFSCISSRLCLPINLCLIFACIPTILPTD